MTAIEIVFWLSLAILFYCYAGYGFILFLWNNLKRPFISLKRGAESPVIPVTLVVAAFNEEEILEQKIRNTLALDYPAGMLNVIFITDGSTDHSPEIIERHSFIRLLHQSERKGKSAAIKRAMRFVETPVVIFSDANSMLNPGSIKAIVRHYTDERVGGVAGEKKILNDEHGSVVGQAEGLYWKYESFMKQQDADFNTVVGAAGELFSIRSDLFMVFNDNQILDDFVISMNICLAGYKIEYEPHAYAVEAPSASLTDEQRRKIRIAAGAYQSINYLRQCLNVFRFPLLSIQYFSRRFLRWVVCPFLILLVIACNVWLVLNQQGEIFSYFLVAQGVFYLLALLGRVFMAFGWRVGVLNIPFYFVFMNYCLVRGFFKHIQGSQTVLWEKSMREAIE